MKTNLQNVRLIALLIAITATFVAQPMRASAIDTLLITENSSTSLTATLTLSNGTTSSPNVTFNAADRWTIALPGFGFPTGTLGQQLWTEPDAAGEVNVVHAVIDNNGAPTGDITIFSDLVASNPALANNTPDTMTFTLNGSTLSVTFNDKGDVASAPDTGSTLGLLFLALAALVGASRLRSIRLA